MAFIKVRARDAATTVTGETLVIRWEVVKPADYREVEYFEPIERGKVPGGWFIRYGHGITFYPDPEHRWNENLS